MIAELSAAHSVAMAALHSESFEAAWPDTDMQAHTEKDITLGWLNGVVLAGFIIVQKAADQSEILTIAVDKACRRKGIGLKLLQAAEAAAQDAGATILFLEVAEDNASAIALYQRAGYESFGIRPAYYKRAGGRIAARLFRKNLTDVA